MFKLSGRLKRSIDMIDYQKGDVFVDVGCKSAWASDYLKDCLLVNLDLDEKELIKKKKSNPKLNFVVADARALPFKDGVINGLMLFEVLEHVPKGTELMVLKEINRSLCLGGKLFFSTPNNSFLFTVTDPAYWLIGHRHYDLKKIKLLFKKTGLKILQEYIGGGIYETIYLIFLYIVRLFKLEFDINFFKNKIDKEYNCNGKNTIMIKAMKI